MKKLIMVVLMAASLNAVASQCVTRCVDGFAGGYPVCTTTCN